MRYKLLGRSGLRVSETCLGTMTFGEAWGWGASDAESGRILDAFLDYGGNFVDTANIYTSGNAESLLGKIVTPARRNALVLATKFGDALPGKDPNAAGNHRKSMVQSVEASLQRLRTDRVDILFVHSWDFTTRPDEIMRALDDLVRQGKILYAGVSDAPAWVISRCNEMADQRGWSPFVVNQIEYSLVERTSERDILPMSRALDIGVVAWSPLAGGVLTGKYTRGKPEESPRRMDAAAYKALSARNIAIAEALDAVADEVGCSSAQAALAWVAVQGVIPIIGATKVHQLEQNMGYLEVRLAPDHLARLDAASAIELGFPHDFDQTAKGFIYGGLVDLIYRHRDEGVGVTTPPGAGPAAVGQTAFSYTDVMVAPLGEG